MAQSYDFKGSNVETATRNGLTELGLNAEDVEVEVISRGGIFSKAVVRITPKEKEITEEEVKEEPTETAEEKIISEIRILKGLS